MSDDDTEQNPSGQMILAQALKMAGGTPYWWRRELEKMASGIEAGISAPKLSSRLLSEMAARLRMEIIETATHANPAVRPVVKEHYELGLKEIHEFAEIHALRISKSVALSAHEGGPSVSR